MIVSEHIFLYPSNVLLLNGFNVYVTMCLIIILGSIIINTWDRALPNKMLQRWASGSGFLADF